MSDFERRLNKLEAGAAAGDAALKVIFLRGDEPEPENLEPAPPGVVHLLVRFIKPMPDGPYGRA